MKALILAAIRWLVALLIAIGERRGRAAAREEQASTAQQQAAQAVAEAQQTEERIHAEVAAARRDGTRKRLRDGAF